MPDPSAIVLSFPERDGDRLRLALRGLDAALDAQAAALADWRGELQGLAGAVDGLGSSLTRYRCTLEITAEGLRRAGDEALALERAAEGWVAATQG